MTTGEEPSSNLGNDAAGWRKAGGQPSRRDPARWDPAPTGQHPRTPGPTRRPARTGPLPPHRPTQTGQHRRPFAPTTGQVPVTTGKPGLDRLLGRAYRWRAAAGLLLALVMTVSIAVVYRSATNTGSDVESVAGPSSTAEIEPSLGEVTDFSGDPAVTPEQSATDDSLSAAETGAATPTTVGDTTETAPTSTEAPSTATEEETTSSETSTTLDDSTSTVPNENPADDPDGSTSSTVDASSVTGCPASAPPAGGARIEAETGTPLGSASARSDHVGFSGSGYVGEIIIEGAGIELATDSTVAGPRQLTICYAAGEVPALPDPPRTITVAVNGGAGRQVVLDRVGVWTQWWVAGAGQVELVEGTNTISLTWAAGDTGWVNLDWVELGAPPAE